MAGLAATYGRGAMTNHWIDLKNSDCLFVIGANPAENHPASMTWINEAIENRGAKLVVVDPRITRTAAKAHVYAPIRSGTDIAFLGGLINYALETGSINHEYVLNYTNASFLIHPDYKDAADLDGLFSGFNSETMSYDRSTWSYQVGEDGQPLKDPTLEDPNCVFQILKRHYARYTPEMVERICGTPRDKFLKVAETVLATAAPGKSAAILYAMGQTHHTVGSQNVRSMAILQLLLGNIGLPGGGVNALRGESNVQGSTDMGLLYHVLPAYMATPNAAEQTLEDYLANRVKAAGSGYWQNTPKFFVSLLKAWWGDNATPESNFAYGYLPKVSGNYSWIALFEAMLAGVIRGLWILGMNPAVSGPNARLERKALANLDWMVVQEIFDTETCSFWRGPDMNPADVQTEVFVLPAADAMEKAGSISTSGRLIQWREQVAAAPGEARSDAWIIDRVYREVRALYEREQGAFPDPILNLKWDYGDPVDPERIAEEVNGYWAADVVEYGKAVGEAGQLLSGFGQLRDDGTTACGCWIYAGYYYPREDGEGNILPSCKRRGTQDPGGLGTYPYWAWVWPANRHILYNRCSADASGKPWAEDKALIWWDGEKWTGYDVPDFGATKAPDGPGGTDAFIMRPDGRGGLFSALNEGPLPEHYEPVESPVSNAMSSQQINPVVKVWDSLRGEAIGDNIGTPDQYPIVATTYRLVEHWQAGGMSRWLPWLAETQPEPFVEMSKELAAEKGIANGDRVAVTSARGRIEAVAVVTARFKPFTVDGKVVHQIGIPWHYGWRGLATGDSANDITPHVGDGNTMIPEYKAFLVDVQRIGGR